MPKKPAAPAWGELLGAAAARDAGAAAQAALAALAAAEGPEQLDAEGLLGAVAGALQSGDGQRLLVACATLLAALRDDEAQALGVAQLAGDHVYSGLSSALACGIPLPAAAAARGLCALTAAAAAASGAKGGEERHERLGRSRKIAPQLRAMLDAHPKSVQVQEALAEGCCELLCSDHVSLGGHVATLWAMLWPLVVHSRDSVSKAAELCLCRLTWSAKPAQAPGGGGGGPDAQHTVPNAEEAIASACKEFEDVFKALEVAARQAGPAGAAAQLGQRQSLRLLGLAKGLLRHGQSKTQAYGRREKGYCLDDSIAVVPVARLVGVVDTVVMAVFRDSSVALRALGAARGGPAHGLAAALDSALDLAATLAEVAGGAVLPQAGRIRRWLEVLTEVPPSTHWRHCRMTCSLALTLAQAAPSVLLSKQLVGRLVSFALALLQPSEQAIQRAASTRSAEAGVRAPGRKKRKAGEAFGGAGEGPGASGSLAQPAFPEACRVLARLASLAAPMLAPAQVAAVCEQVAKILWQGLCAPTPDQAASAGSDMVSARAAAMASFCQEVCRDAASAVALLDVAEALHQGPRPGVVPLAPSLRDAFAALLGTVASAHRRRCAFGGAGGAVGARAAEVRAAVLAAASAWGGQAAQADGAPAGVSFVWPEVAPAPPLVGGAASEEEEEKAPPPAAAPAPSAAPPSPEPPAPEPAAPPEVPPTAPPAAVPAIDAMPAAVPAAPEAPAAPEVPAAPEASEVPAAPPPPAAAAAAESKEEAAAPPAAEAPPAAAEEARAGEEPLAARAAEAEGLGLAPLPEPPGGAATLELFPDINSPASPIPSLCMDSPSGGEDL